MLQGHLSEGICALGRAAGCWPRKAGMDQTGLGEPIRGRLLATFDGEILEWVNNGAVLKIANNEDMILYSGAARRGVPGR